MTARDPMISYVSRRSLFRKWTSLGVIAITCSSVGLMVPLAMLVVLVLPSGIGIPWWATGFAWMGYAVGIGVGALLGMVAMLAGTADPLSRRDAHLGLIALLMSLSGFLFPVVLIVAISVWR
jgi:hypothetical protein